MAKKGAQKYISTGCLICGEAVGGGIGTHVPKAHGLKYASYQKCFFPAGGKALLTQRIESGKNVVLTVLVRRFRLADSN